MQINCLKASPNSRKEIFPILDNLVKIYSPSEGSHRLFTVSQVLESFFVRLKLEKELSGAKLSLVGSSVTNQCIAPLYTECGDVDARLVLKVESMDSSEELLRKVDEIFRSNLQSLLQSQSSASSPLKLKEHQIEAKQPLMIGRDHIFARYILSHAEERETRAESIQGTSSHLSLDLSIHIITDEAALLNVGNLDSFEIDLNLVDEEVVYFLSSSTGDLEQAQKEIQSGIFTTSLKSPPNYLGWFRFLIGLTEGLVDPSPENNINFYEASKVRSDFLVSLKKFIKEKRSSPEFHLIYSINALFHSLDLDKKTDFSNQIVQDLTRHPFKANWLKELTHLVGEYPPSHLPTLLKVFLPFVADKVQVKNHLGTAFLQAEFRIEGKKNLYILIPLLEESDAPYLVDVSPLLRKITPFELDPYPPVYQALFRQYASESSRPSDSFFPWALKFAALGIALSPIDSNLNSIQWAKHLEKETSLSRKILEALLVADFSLARVLCLLSPKLSTDELEELIKTENLASFFSQEYQRVALRLPFLIDLIEASEKEEGETEFLLSPVVTQLFGTIPEQEKSAIGCELIKNILISHQNNRTQLSHGTWKILQKITLLSISPTKPWKRILIEFNKNLSSFYPLLSSNLPMREFLSFLSKATDSVELTEFPLLFPKESDKFTYYLRSLTLINPVDAEERVLILEKILGSPLLKKKKESLIKEHFKTYKEQDPFLFEISFSLFLKRNQYKEALELLNIQHALFDEIDPFPYYLAIAEKNPSYLEASEACLETMRYKPLPSESIWPLYITFQMHPQVVEFIEENYLVKLEIPSPPIESLERLTSRIHSLTLEKKPESALELLRILQRVSLDKTLIPSSLIHLLTHCKEQIKPLLPSIKAYFHFLLPDLLEILLEKKELSLSHHFVLEERVPSHLQTKYVAYFEEMFATQKKKTFHPSLIEQSHTYLQIANEEKRIRFAFNCAEPPLEELFKIALSSVQNILDVPFEWNDPSLQKTLRFFADSKQLTPELALLVRRNGTNIPFILVELLEKTPDQEINERVISFIKDYFPDVSDQLFSHFLDQPDFQKAHQVFLSFSGKGLIDVKRRETYFSQLFSQFNQVPQETFNQQVREGLYLASEKEKMSFALRCCLSHPSFKQRLFRSFEESLKTIDQKSLLFHTQELPLWNDSLIKGWFDYLDYTHLLSDHYPELLQIAIFQAENFSSFAVLIKNNKKMIEIIANHPSLQTALRARIEEEREKQSAKKEEDLSPLFALVLHPKLSFFLKDILLPLLQADAHSNVSLPTMEQIYSHISKEGEESSPLIKLGILEKIISAQLQGNKPPEDSFPFLLTFYEMYRENQALLTSSHSLKARNILNKSLEELAIKFLKKKNEHIAIDFIKKRIELSKEYKENPSFLCHFLLNPDLFPILIKDTYLYYFVLLSASQMLSSKFPKKKAIQRQLLYFFAEKLKSHPNDFSHEELRIILPCFIESIDSILKEKPPILTLFRSVIYQFPLREDLQSYTKPLLSLTEGYSQIFVEDYFKKLNPDTDGELELRTLTSFFQSLLENPLTNNVVSKPFLEEMTRYLFKISDRICSDVVAECASYFFLVGNKQSFFDSFNLLVPKIHMRRFLDYKKTGIQEASSDLAVCLCYLQRHYLNHNNPQFNHPVPPVFFIYEFMEEVKKELPVIASGCIMLFLEGISDGFNPQKNKSHYLADLYLLALDLILGPQSDLCPSKYKNTEKIFELFQYIALSPLDFSQCYAFLMRYRDFFIKHGHSIPSHMFNYHAFLMKCSKLIETIGETVPKDELFKVKYMLSALYRACYNKSLDKKYFLEPFKSFIRNDAELAIRFVYTIIDSSEHPINPEFIQDVIRIIEECNPAVPNKESIIEEFMKKLSS